MRYHIFVAPLTMLFLSGCLGPMKLDSSLKNNNVIVARQAIGKFMTQEQKWWLVFNDPVVNQFVDHLLNENISLQIAYARLNEARALTTTTRAALLPDISGSVAVNRGNLSTPKSETLSQVGLSAQWALDIFGKTRASISAAEARAMAFEATVDDVKNIIIADIVRAVIEWRQAQQTIKEVNNLLKDQDQQVSILNMRANAGLIDASFPKRGQAQREQTATQLPLAYAASEKAYYQIEVLLNAKDNDIADYLKTAEVIPIRIPSPNLMSIIALDVLKQRPDLRASQSHLCAARADLAQTVAALWPQININVFFGVQDGTNGLLVAKNPIWSIANAISVPILNFGRLRSMVKSADAKVQQSILEYENKVNLALQQTKTALSDYLHGVNAMNSQAQTLNYRQETVSIARERFERGLTDMTDLTTAQTELDQASLSLISSQTSAAIAYIQLQKALGTATLLPLS